MQSVIEPKKIQSATPPKKTPEPEPKPQEELERPPEPQTPSIELGEVMADADWQAILQAIKQKHNTLYGIIRMAKPRLQEQTLTLQFGFPFHQKRMNEAKNKQLIQDVIKSISGRDITIECVSEPQTAAPKLSAPVRETKDSATLDTITDIFGGGEVLEN